MGRRLLPMLAASALFLATSACEATGGADDTTPTPTVGADPAPTTDAPRTETGTATGAPDAASDDAAATSGGPAASDEAVAEEVEGGEEGQAAADRAKEFLLAIVDADPEACTMIVSFSDTTRPMRDLRSDLELCQTQLPETMAASVQAQGLTEEGRAILEAMQITGADVDGSTAIVDRDNFSDLFAESMGQAPITLVRIDGEWFVDLSRSFQDS